MAAPTHVLFDFFGTLVAYNPSRVEQGYERSHSLLLSLGARLDQAEFLASWDRTFEEFEVAAERSLDEYPMASVCAEFLRRVLPHAPAPSDVARFQDTYLSEWNKGVAYISGVPELLASLAERFTVVLVTNTHTTALILGHLRALNVEEHFAAIVASVDHGKRKPSACIFERALLQSGGRPETAVYVGDSFAADYRGATSAGLRCLLIDPGRRHEVPDGHRLGHVLETPSRLASFA